MLEASFDIPFTAALALREKQIQQNYRPIIAVHKWFARRPGTLFRSLVLAEFGDAPVKELFYRANDFSDKRVADPFMGGGTPLLEANRVGCDVSGFDINPMAAWIVKEELAHLDIAAYYEAAERLTSALEAEVGTYYLTDCPIYGDQDVPVKYFLWVKVLDCAACEQSFDLFPGYLVAEDKRHTSNLILCADCGHLNAVENTKKLGSCTDCGTGLKLQGPAKRNRCQCPHCGHENTYPQAAKGPLQHRLFAIEYFNPERKAQHKGRFFKTPDAKDLAKLAAVEKRWAELEARFVPDQAILPGDETNRLHRWGYQYYRELFNNRQLLGLELSCRLISQIEDERIQHALATNLSDLLRYQNMLCRYDSKALKSLDIFSVHGFPVGLVHCESNLLGISNSKKSSVGSGGWSNIINKYAKAKAYCDDPFEVQIVGKKKVLVPITGEWIGEKQQGQVTRQIQIRCQSSTDAHLPDNSLDAVFTDPPYFGNVQYGELMDFCYVWLRQLVGEKMDGFAHVSSRAEKELTGNMTQGRGLAHFTAGISQVYIKMARALKPGSPLAFTYHHNKAEAYYAMGVGILDSGLSCTATLPCPAEMSGSIHIQGTGSSIIDTIFVCRKTQPSTKLKPSAKDRQLSLLEDVFNDLQALKDGGVKPTLGDMRCIAFGHITRLSIEQLQPDWDREADVEDKLQRFAAVFNTYDLPDGSLLLASADGLHTNKALSA